jgi:hypothetical protein
MVKGPDEIGRSGVALWVAVCILGALTIGSLTTELANYWRLKRGIIGEDSDSVRVNALTVATDEEGRRSAGLLSPKGSDGVLLLTMAPGKASIIRAEVEERFVDLRVSGGEDKTARILISNNGGRIELKVDAEGQPSIVGIDATGKEAWRVQ